MKRCAFCGGRLGLISHRKGNLSFCKRVHKSAYLERQREYQRAEDRGMSALPPIADRVSLGAVSRHECL